MSNPYLPASIDPTGSHTLPMFEDNMVLRAQQLNTQFGFLLSQHQATRAQLLGVGVAAGLQPAYTPDGRTITVSAGFGVTTDGDLLSQPARTFTKCVPFVTTEDYAPITYDPVTGISSKGTAISGWWELVDTPTDGPQPQNLTAAGPLSNFVVVLYHEFKEDKADTCTSRDCDRGGSEYLRTVRMLLVPKSAAVPRLLRLGQQQAANAHAQLPALAMRRLQPTATNTFYQARLNTNYALLASAAQTLREALDQAGSLLSSVDDMLTIGGLSALAGWKSQLLTKLNANRYEPTQQYVYAWLKDLYEAYEEFRQATAQWLVNGPGTADTFPMHLVLGELVPTATAATYRYTHRHPWLRSAVTDAAPDARSRALWLFRRIGHLIEGFAFDGAAMRAPEAEVLVRAVETETRAGSETVPMAARAGSEPVNTAARTYVGATGTGTGAAAEVLLADVAAASPLRITPDAFRGSFDQRSLPFYYQSGTRQYWSYARAVAGRTQDIHSYHRPLTGAPAQVNNPLIYQVEPYGFYRVEGLLGQPIGPALDQLLAQRRAHNLAFDVVAVRHDDKQPPLINNAAPSQYADLERLFAAAQTALREAVVINNTRSEYTTSSQAMQTQTVQKVQLQSDALEQALAAAVPATLSRQQKRVVKQAQQLALNQLTTADASSFALTALPTTGIDIVVPTYQPLRHFSESPDPTILVLTQTSPATFKLKLDAFKAQSLPLNILNLLVPVTDVWAQYQARQVSLQSLVGQLTLPALLAQNPGLEAGAGVPRGGTLVLVYSTADANATPASTAPSYVVADYYLPYQLVSMTDAPIQFVLNPAAATDPGDEPTPVEPTPVKPPTVDFDVPPVVYVKNEQGRYTAKAEFSYRWENATTLLWDFGDGTGVVPVNLATRSDEEDPHKSHTISHTYDVAKPEAYQVSVIALNNGAAETDTLKPE